MGTAGGIRVRRVKPRDEPSYARKNVIHDESRAADVDIVAP